MVTSTEQFSILLIDDDEVDRITVRRALKKAKFPSLLIEAVNGGEAIEQLKIGYKLANRADLSISDSDSESTEILNRLDNFDLILLDYLLPDIDGLHLLGKIKELGIDLPIIVLTGQGDEQIAVEMMKLGASDYLSKGRIEPDTLIRSINNAIRVHQAEQAAALANQRLRISNDLLVSKNEELEKQQQQIKLQNIKLQEAYNLKSEFLATMSHELRTPMNAIMGFSQLLLRQHQEPLSGQQENLVRRIFHNSKNLLTMINEMLDFSKIEAGKLEIFPQKFDLEHLALATVEELRSLAAQKHIELTAKIELEDKFVFQDFNFVKRASINLLSNAIKFTDAGRVALEITAVDDEIAIAIRDTGIGIALEDREKIFEAFRQADQTFTRQHSGTGLGLAITDSLVKMMGGEIILDSEIGKGSTFTIKIPRRYDVDKLRKRLT